MPGAAIPITQTEGNMGIAGLLQGKGLEDVEGGASRYSERNANDWARDWAAARARAGAVGEQAKTLFMPPNMRDLRRVRPLFIHYFDT